MNLRVLHEAKPGISTKSDGVLVRRPTQSSRAARDEEISSAAIRGCARVPRLASAHSNRNLFESHRGRRKREIGTGVARGRKGLIDSVGGFDTVPPELILSSRLHQAIQTGQVGLW